VGVREPAEDQVAGDQRHLRVRDLPLRLFLLAELVRRDFQSRYAGSALGFLWSFAQPLWQLLLFTFVFSWVLRVSLLGERTESFALFLFCGLLPFMAVSEGVTRAATSVTDNASLVKKLRFPVALLVVTVVATALLHEGIALALFLVVLGVFGEGSPASLGWLAVALPLQVALTVGLGLLLAALHVFLRDIAQALGLFFSAWFYFTPIVYPLSRVPSSIRGWIELNPLTALVDLYRSALLGGLPSATRGIVALVVTTIAVLLLGAATFRRLSPSFADEL
jgi:lipopolysaccharide transport system permease protein